MSTDIGQWLEGLDLAKYQDAFTENEVEFGDLTELTDDDLKEMGLPIGPRRRVLRVIATLNEKSPEAPDQLPEVPQAAVTQDRAELLRRRDVLEDLAIARHSSSGTQ